MLLQIQPIFMSGQQGDTNLPVEGQEDTDLEAKLQELRTKNAKLAEDVTKLQSHNDKVIGENRKATRIKKVLEAIDIDLEAENAEEVLLEKLSASLAAQSEAAQAAAAHGATPGAPASVSPESLEMKSQLKLLQKKLVDMETRTKEAEKREAEANEKRKRDFVELRVKEALQKAGCIQPNHFYQLKSNVFRLSDDGETIIGGPEHDPRSLEDQIETLKDDQEFSMYFRGLGASGSGMSKGQNGFGGQSLKNPFRTDQLNVTEASTIFSKDPEKAKRLMLEARSAGKLDSRLAQLAGI
jgi:hypothetical protein